MLVDQFSHETMQSLIEGQYFSPIFIKEKNSKQAFVYSVNPGILGYIKSLSSFKLSF